eukprot:gnl/Spiro4/25851_TR12870_c0_g1_i1.p2 gnl/Spiro4/25851_TR12870_c0_g1~~gnl/Spiro4/25851_TR12870_c0_g1_i1.p2  ORF type:complete len:203 (+),score=49.15 gnl/Spiro4/25851_TR12870_c0_g1_i1:355-963(+)
MHTSLGVVKVLRIACTPSSFPEFYRQFGLARTTATRFYMQVLHFWLMHTRFRLEDMRSGKWLHVKYLRVFKAATKLMHLEQHLRLLELDVRNTTDKMKFLKKQRMFLLAASLDLDDAIFQSLTNPESNPLNHEKLKTVLTKYFLTNEPSQQSYSALEHHCLKSFADLRATPIEEICHGEFTFYGGALAEDPVLPKRPQLRDV